MLADMHGKYIVMLMGVPKEEQDTCPHVVPCPVIESEHGVRVYDTYKEASDAKAQFKDMHPLCWYGIAKVNIPKEQR